jgi:hypothetical protein
MNVELGDPISHRALPSFPISKPGKRFVDTRQSIARLITQRRRVRSGEVGGRLDRFFDWVDRLLIYVVVGIFEYTLGRITTDLSRTRNTTGLLNLGWTFPGKREIDSAILLLACAKR